jgi:small subunit ribosomal protein S13
MAKKETEDEFKYLVRIANTDIDGNKRVPVGLSSIRGIGTRVGGVICNLSGVDPNKKIGYLTEEEIEKLDAIAKAFHTQKVPSWLFNRRKDYDTGKDLHILGSDLIMSLREDINRLRKIRSYRGIRHELGLPVRGQRTRTSFRKGATVGVRRKKSKQ